MNLFKLFLCLAFLFCSSLFAQNKKDTSKVLMSTIGERYVGPVKKGLASGKGEAFGIHHYIGMFKNGLPNGKGKYLYNDSVYYEGEFQDGILEGKGEMHDKQKTGADSVVKGYWSGGIYRGKNYTTYSFNGIKDFDSFDVLYSSSSGNRVTVETSTTTGTPNSQLSPIGGNTMVLSLTELVSQDNNCVVKFLSDYYSATKSSLTFEISKFPAKLMGRLSNGKIINIELYKAADWTIRLYINK